MDSNSLEYFVYIVTNFNKTTLYTGITNSLCARIREHWQNRNCTKSFAGKYKCHHLIYYEKYNDVEKAINREKEIKKWSRDKKEALIATKNPDWIFHNKRICGNWPPEQITKRY